MLVAASRGGHLFCRCSAADTVAGGVPRGLLSCRCSTGNVLCFWWRPGETFVLPVFHGSHGPRCRVGRLRAALMGRKWVMGELLEGGGVLLYSAKIR